MALPGWLDPLYTAEEMRASDAWAIDEVGVPSLDLMERAGTGLARVVARIAGPGPVRVVAGRGNNGGGGLLGGRPLRGGGGGGGGLAVGGGARAKWDRRANPHRPPG